MKVIAINGSPKSKGNTYHALRLVADELEKEKIEVKFLHIGNDAIRGCNACGSCLKTKDNKCILKGDEVNDYIQQMKEADGILLGSPVYYADLAGTMKCFLDRVFYVAGANNGLFRHKVGASVVAVRRTGGIPAYNSLNNFLHYSEMFVPSSNYWNVLHGAKPGDVLEDEEGMQIARMLGKNMAWLMKAVQQLKITDPLPEKESKIYTNFIR